MDEKKFQGLAQTLLHAYEGALVSGMVYLGDELGIYRAMKGHGPLTSAAVAVNAGLHERFVREWLYTQVASGIIDYSGDGLFELSAEAGILLGEPNDIRTLAGLFDSFPQRTALISELPQSFRTGIGVSWARR